MSFIQDCIDTDQLDVALDHLRSEKCTYVNVKGLDTVQDDVFLYANILSLKKPKSNAKPLNVTWKTVSTYHRLILCREVVGGALFYMIFETESESIRMLKYTSENYVGATFALYEPLKNGELHGITILTCDTSFLPIPLNAVNMKIEELVPEIEVTSGVQGFFVQVSSLRLSRVSAIDACDYKQCDSQHLRTGPCPGVLGGNSVHRLAMSAIVHVEELKHEDNTEKTFGIISENLLTLFVADESVTCKKLDVRPFRKSVERTLQHYVEENVPWLVGGWYKRIYSADGSPLSSRQLHVTFLQPKKILASAPLYVQEKNVIRAIPNASIRRGASARAGDFVVDEERVQNGV